MKTIIYAATVLAAVGISGATWAAERTVTLLVENMSCVSCPYTVREALKAVPGVKSAEVSFEEKTAVVVFDHEQANVAALTAATTNAGYPSRPLGEAKVISAGSADAGLKAPAE